MNYFVIVTNLRTTKPHMYCYIQIPGLGVAEMTALFDILLSRVSKTG